MLNLYRNKTESYSQVLPNSLCYNNDMKIILVATAKGKNVVFVDDALRVHMLEEAVPLAKSGKFANVHVVQKGGGAYLRSSRNVPPKDQLEQLAISSRQLFDSATDIRHAVSTPVVARYLQLYEHTLQKDGGPLIVIEGKVKITKEAAKAKLLAHKGHIFDAAKKFNNVDPYLLGAIIIDEIARFTPFEDIGEQLAVFSVGKNVSAGVAQVQMDTARGLIREGYYNPNPSNPKLAPDKIVRTSRAHLYAYVKDPKHSIFFAAARMRELTDKWKKFVDLNERPEIIATLYHLSYKPPHNNPEANPRGLQIAGEFYALAKEWLR